MPILVDQKTSRFPRGKALFIVAGIFVALGIASAAYSSWYSSEETALAEAHLSELQSATKRIQLADAKRTLEADFTSTRESAEDLISTSRDLHKSSEKYAFDTDRRFLLNSIEDLENALAAPGVGDAATQISELTRLIEQMYEAIDAVGTPDEVEERRFIALANKLGFSQDSRLTISMGLEWCSSAKAAGKPNQSRLVAARLVEGFDGPEFQAAFEVLCPEYLSAWRLGQQGFVDGNYIVGIDVQPGLYTTTRGVRQCYWERNAGTGGILDNFFGSAHAGLTIRVNAGEGLVTEGCGVWLPVD